MIVSPKPKENSGEGIRLHGIQKRPGNEKLLPTSTENLASHPTSPANRRQLSSPNKTIKSKSIALVCSLIRAATHPSPNFKQKIPEIIMSFRPFKPTNLWLFVTSSKRNEIPNRYLYLNGCLQKAYAP